MNSFSDESRAKVTIEPSIIGPSRFVRVISRAVRKNSKVIFATALTVVASTTDNIRIVDFIVRWLPVPRAVDDSNRRALTQAWTNHNEPLPIDDLRKQSARANPGCSSY